jgi:hypothetical protein
MNPAMARENAALGFARLPPAVRDPPAGARRRSDRSRGGGREPAIDQERPTDLDIVAYATRSGPQFSVFVALRRMRWRQRLVSVFRRIT